MVQFASYLRRVLCKTRLIFPRINGPSVLTFSISRTQLSRSLEQAFLGSVESRRWSVTIMENRHLFGLYVLFPSLGDVMFFRQFALCPFINCAYICAYLKLKNLKETILWGNITWHEMG